MLFQDDWTTSKVMFFFYFLAMFVTDEIKDTIKETAAKKE